MEKFDEKQKKNGTVNGISRNINTNLLQWAENITAIDLHNSNISNLDVNLKFPSNLLTLNLSNNSLVDIPSVVLELRNLQSLDLSFNQIKYFDNTPAFCHSIIQLNLANNKLNGPPYWVWSETPRNLEEINLSSNIYLEHELNKDNEYFVELLHYNTLVSTVKMYNCRLDKHISLLGTFPKAKILQLGNADMSCLFANVIENIPSQGLEKCCDIERLILSNMNICDIKSNIDIFSNLKEINLSQNRINSLPNEFYNLISLETCVLSGNSLLYLSDDVMKLKKLVYLYLDMNQICMLPENICELPNLKVLDLYDNGLYAAPTGQEKIEEIDLAQNYFEEPNDIGYIQKKEKLRLNVNNERDDGRKIVHSRPESAYSSNTTDDEELSLQNSTQSTEIPKDRPSSPEDWDSDDYWIPHYYRQITPPPQSSWLLFVKRKMEEGNFCPMDAHPVPVADLVKYEKQCNPQVWYESEGQFDDLTDDDS